LIELTENQFRKIGIFKCGNIGTSPLLELLLDELADRQDIKVRTVTTGSKMSPEDVEEALPKIFEFSPDLVIVISPNTALPGPAKAREAISSSGRPGLVISDSPGKRAKADIEKQGLGYMIITGDPMIGARKEFLDAVEMALFNSNISKVLAVSGVYRIVHQEIDKVIEAIKTGQTLDLPRLIIDLAAIRDNAELKNPYAKAKAMAAYALAEKLAEINIQACFMEKESEKYVYLVTCAHEIAQTAAKLAEEAREIEKYNDTLLRKPAERSGMSGTLLLLSAGFGIVTGTSTSERMLIFISSFTVAFRLVANGEVRMTVPDSLSFSKTSEGVSSLNVIDIALS
jgi:methylenetetrahydromethanopterin dehydrogenase